MRMNYKVLGFLDGAVELYEWFKGDKPFCAGKIGNAELMCAYNYFYAQHLKQNPIQWSPVIEKEIFFNAGVFPQTEEARIYFSEELSKAVANTDVISPWNSGLGDFEKRFILSRNPNSVLVDLQSLEPFYCGLPWSSLLKGKNVLVITPFTETFKNQYANREKIWENPNVLPEFNLITLHHPTSKGIDSSMNPYSTWKDMVNDIKEKMSKIDFDVALIGTGASSLPLASYAKTLGKKAIHLGGALQLLFGVKGKRWEQMKIFNNHFFNKHWVRPSALETPKDCELVEGATYW